jgi:release factor glutamine methyltransferase
MLLEDMYERKISELELKEFSDIEVNNYLNQVQKLDFLPLQYVSNKAMFNSKYYFVNSDVLIPKQETEQLINISKEIISNKNHKNVLDIGTGSGIIAIELKLKFPDVNVFATDISGKALMVAQKNAKIHNVNVIFEQLDLINQKLSTKIDFIVANLPYLHEAVSIDTKTKENEPHLALFSPNKGTHIFERLFDKVANYQIPMALEVGHDNAQLIIEIGKNTLKEAKFEIIQDINGYERFILINY